VIFDVLARGLQIDEPTNGESANQRISELANRRIGESANQRIGESANWRIGELANWRIGESELKLVMVLGSRGGFRLVATPITFHGMHL
jgi:hypothetical protein